MLWDTAVRETQMERGELILSLLPASRGTVHVRAVSTWLACDAWRRRHLAAEALGALLRSLALDDPHEVTRLPPSILAYMVDEHCFSAAAPRMAARGAKRKDPLAPRLPRWRVRERRNVYALL